MRKRHKTSHPGIYFRVDAQGARRYIIWYQDSLGKGRTVTLPLGANLEDAKRRQSDLRVRKASGERIVPTKRTVGQLLDEYLAGRTDLTPKTKADYEHSAKVVKDEIGFLKLSSLSSNTVFELRAKLRKGHKTWTVKKYETPLKGALTMAVREGWISRNPYADPLPHERLKDDTEEKRCLSTEEVSLLLKPTTTSSLRWRTLFALLVLSGLRISEALALTWADVDFKRNLIHVRKGKTKSAERSVMLIDALRAILMAWKLKQDPGHVFVFSAASGLPVSRRNALRAVRAAEKKAGLPKYTLHELRHTFASMLIAQGEPITLISEQLGHKDPHVTLKVYAHFFDREKNLEQAAERLQRAIGGLV